MKDVIDALLSGDTDKINENQILSTKNKVVTFISSTFTDTKTERNALIIGQYILAFNIDTDAVDIFLFQQRVPAQQ